MIADKVCKERCRFFPAGVRGNEVNAIRRFVEAISSLVNGLFSASNLHPNCALDHISNHRAGVAMGCRRTSRWIGYFDCSHLQPGSIPAGVGRV